MDRVIPVVEIKDINETEKTLSALRAGGVNCAEITFRTACAEEAIKLAVKLFPDMNIGAGTVINEEQAIRAVNAGAKFIVSPGFPKKSRYMFVNRAFRIIQGVLRLPKSCRLWNSE